MYQLQLMTDRFLIEYRRAEKKLNGEKNTLTQKKYRHVAKINAMIRPTIQLQI